MDVVELDTPVVDVKPPRAPECGLYRQDDGRVVLVKKSKRSWYAIGLRRRPDFTLERDYLGHHTKGLYPSSMLTVEEATDWLVG